MPTWEFEPGHTSATFAVRHMMITIVRGHFKNLKGKFHFDPADPARGSIEVTIDAASFSTAEPERDAHLRSADFLDVANYPTITFKSTSVEPTGTNHSKVTGDLTIRGVTRPVILEVEYFGSRLPINQVANISVPEPRMIVISPWDKKALGPIEKAIMKSDLGMMPNNDGNAIRLNIPQLTDAGRRLGSGQRGRDYH